MTARQTALAALLSLLPGALHAADWPSRPIVVLGSPPAEFAAFVQSEVTRWTEVARKTGLKPES